MPALEEFVRSKNKELEKNSLKRSIKNTYRTTDSVHINRDGKEYISFCCNDYLGLSQDEMVIEASIEAAWRYGAGAGASRLITGNNPLYDELERNLARIKCTEASCIFGSGYLANIGVISALVGKGDLVIADKLVHSCIYDGIKLSGATLKVYSHNSLNKLSNILKEKRKNHSKCLIITETIFSMDGDRAPIEELYKLAEENDAWLMTDDAHGFGVINQENKAHIQVGTLSKAVGCYGGYVCASKEVIDYIKTSAKSLIYSTALPPAVLFSAITALDIMEQKKKKVSEPLRKAKLFTTLLEIKEAESAIVPIIIGGEKETLAAADKLEKTGFLVSAIRPPTVKKGTSRLRVTFSSLHSDKDIEKLASVVKDMGLLGNE